jgi:hypothetical protein
VIYSIDREAQLAIHSASRRVRSNAEALSGHPDGLREADDAGPEPLVVVVAVIAATVRSNIQAVGVSGEHDSSNWTRERAGVTG